MVGKSAALILRQMHPIAIVRDRISILCFIFGCVFFFFQEEARKYDIEIDLAAWFSALCIKDDSVAYHKQKEAEIAKKRRNGGYD